ncbi:hypothetical protein BGZ76_010195 [Entomortierella beljakovae]|nr:hypothetical protein BGZ76_010195 [Entomortierella beljakovae]
MIVQDSKESINGTTTNESFIESSLKENRKQKQDQRIRAAPEVYPANDRHLDEFTVRKGYVDPNDVDRQDDLKKPAVGIAAGVSRASTMALLKHPLEITPMSLKHFIADGLAVYISHVRHPSLIPGKDLFSKVYAMGALPVLIIAMAIIQWGIGLLVIIVKYTKIGAHYYEIFFNDQIALFDETDFVDPDGNDEAVRKLANRTPKTNTEFDYHVANLLLIMSSMVYQRDEKLVARASKILLSIQTKSDRDQATQLLRASEKLIDENAKREFGMRFVGISELKTLGGPFAGLFYNDDSIVLVFKGTSILSFNEYLLDVTIQRIDASEYLYGEVHKGFYESLFPDPPPLNWYERITYDKTNPFDTMMQTIFETAKISKQKTGKPINLWLTGHSLGGALAALTMARLQMPLNDKDPLLQNNPIRHAQHLPGVKTVLQEMLARFSDDQDLVILRDCYSIASPKIGDSIFAEEFARNQLVFCRESPYKSVYWRIVADKDIVPMLPPSCQVDPSEIGIRLHPCQLCTSSSSRSLSWIDGEHEEDSKPSTVHKLSHNYGKNMPQNPPKHLHSLLDYQHVGQLVKIFNAPKTPVVKPSFFETDLTEGVLRNNIQFSELLTQLRKIVLVWNAKDQGAQLNTMTTSTMTSATATTTIDDNDSTNSRRSRAQLAKQISKDVAKAQALYDIDELSRLRQPGLLESALLTIPSLLSHAPATYQRNLVRGRFYFTSFPGVEFEERAANWLDES